MRELKHFILEALLKAEGIPMRDETLKRACRSALQPQPLLTDVERAIRDLEEAKLISGNRDAVDGTTWALTDAGVHKAKQI